MPQVGEIAPDFELEGTEGRFRLSDHRGERVVLLFYPGDFTPVCTRQFCSYAERGDEMAALDATVVGISGQPLERHREFREMHAIPIPLLADIDRKVAHAYGVTQPLLGTRRAVFIVDEQGIVAFRHVHTLGLDYLTVDDLEAALSELPTQA
jgi:thioredoxin-dependent peroxiredoxin